MPSLLRASKRQWALRYGLIAAGGLALVALVVHEIAGENGYQARRQRRQQIQVLSEEIEGLQQDNQQLTERIQGLRVDPHAVEELAREQLRLGRPGEIIVTLPPSPTPPSAPPPATVP